MKPPYTLRVEGTEDPRFVKDPDLYGATLPKGVALISALMQSLPQWRAQKLPDLRLA